MSKEEKILCAAIWFKDIHPRATHRPKNTPGGVVLCGFRHGDIISQLTAMTNLRMADVGISIQGFLTNYNRFVDRLEGAEIFVQTGGELKHHRTKLFSEDLY